MSELTEERYRKLKAEVEKAKAEAERAQGAFNQILAQLEEDFGCKTLKQARTKLEALEEEADEKKTEFETALEAYEKKWKGTS